LQYNKFIYGKLEEEEKKLNDKTQYKGLKLKRSILNELKQNKNHIIPYSFDKFFFNRNKILVALYLKI